MIHAGEGPRLAAADREASAWPGTVVVGVDGLERSADALALGRVLSGCTGANLAAVCVYGSRPWFGSVQTRAQGEVVLASAAAQLNGSPSRTEQLVAAGSPSEGLDCAATELSAGIVVVGSSHRSGLGRMLAGSVGGHLLRSRQHAVAVAPHGFAQSPDPGLRVTGVGFDGSAGAVLALKRAEALALAANGAMRVFAVRPPNRPGEQSPARAEAVATWSAALADHLHAAVRELSSRARALPVLLEGGPVARLVEQSDQVELLVLASHARSRVHRAMLGSVAEGVIAAATCPVLVVPAPDADDAEMAGPPPIS